MSTMTALEAKNGFGQFLDAAQRAPVTVTKNGREVGAMFSRADLEAKGIHFDELHFQPMPQPQVPSAPSPTLTGTRSPTQPLTLAEARIGLAATFGVKPEAVEITIRG